MNHSASQVSLFFSIKAYAARLAPSTPLSWLGWMAVPVVVGASLFAFSQSGIPPTFRQVALANEPLYASTTVDKPALALALSVEYPTVGAQYTPGGNLDNTYSNAIEYLGYYDAESCYTYNNAPTETPASGLTTADYKRFDRSGPATNRRCTNAFSGNFLNWASSSAIDMLRVALSGGDRYIDTENLTILQRAVIPNGDPICMWNSTNFPAKQLTRNGDGSNSYWGAVPTALITEANGNDIWIANTLNRIYFKAGAAASGSCGNTGDYVLGGPVTGNQIESPIRSGTALPAGATQCIGGETGTCAFTGIKEVWYGAGSKWAVAAANNGVNCSAGCNSVFGDPFPGTAKKVYYRNYTGTWTPPTGGTLNSDGFFFARVQVCNVNGSGALQDSRDYGLCRQYPSGKYKPTGVIQKYSDQMRLAAFGYLMDQTASYNTGGRYGGVLRAPMKYVGTKTFDTNGQDNTPSGGNAAAEWNATTGVFNANPDGDTTQNPAISGVINYLNKFGRTGPTPGRYKIYDPVGELHYETLRYLQGLQPSADAISNITTAMQDGFPVYTNWTDPYGGGRSNTSDYSCVKSNIVVIGDINTHDGNRLPAANTANNIPDIAYWRGIANSFERNSGGTYVDGQGTSQTISNPNPANNSMPTGSQTSQIIGSAYWAHIKDIRGTGWTSDTAKQRPGLRVKTFLFDVNEYGGSNNYATRSTSNQFFMAAKYGGFESDPANRGGKPYNTKGNPFKNQNNSNDNAVWQKAGTPGDPLSYYLQSNARGVLNAFDEIFSRASTAARSIAGGGASSSNASSSTMLYTARFDTSNWSGDVVAEPITANASTHELNIGAVAWSAANKLDTRASAATSRNIIVGKEVATASAAATTFSWSNIDTALRTHLNKATPTATPDTRGEDRLNYIRGDRSLEGNPFRVRSSLLGDIVNSTVVYSGPPPKAYSGAGYAAFVAANGSRTPAVFAGANDGMLHAFNAANGTELFGYIPSWLGPKLSALTDPTFNTTHQSYVDAPIAVGEAQVASAGAATDWKTVLVAGTGAGGSGVFALDVSNPSTFDASKVMWEFKREDDKEGTDVIGDMGQVIGQPRILKFKTSGNSATATYRWFAVVASGVNNYVPDLNGNFSRYGKPALFLLALDKPVGQAWTLGTNYFKISFPVDTSTAATIAPGLANFNVLYGDAGEVTDIYAGDMHGKLWKLTFSSTPPSDWEFGKLSAFNKGTAASPDPYPMFIAVAGTTGNPIQPITVAPTLFPGPVQGGKKTYYVAFGTGKYMEPNDNTSTLSNSFYVIYDDGSTNSDGAPVITAAINGRGRLIAGTVNTTTKTITVGSFTWGRATTDTGTVKSGWYFDMPTTGEKLVSQIADLGPRTGAFNTIVPGSSGASPGSCSNTPGSGNQYTFDVVNGSGGYVPSLVGMPGPAVFFTDDSETTETKSDSTGRRIRTITKRGLTIGQSGVSTAAPAPPIKEVVGRIMWRQIYNYRDQKS